ncbi:MAG: type III secretion system export apparatus subunit SctU [Wenzhouxiangella sp.]
MAEKKKNADQTEKPTPKRLKDARRDGQVTKSKDLSSTAIIFIWLLLSYFSAGYIYQHLASLFDGIFSAVADPSAFNLTDLLLEAGRRFVLICMPLVLIAAAWLVLVEFLQVGPVLSWKPFKPQLSRMNPIEGIKRMFSQRNLVELTKSIFKTAGMVVIFFLVIRNFLPDYLLLPYAPASAALHGLWTGVFWIGVWTIFVFFFVSILDAHYQKHAYIKDMMMSKRDIKQEVKQNEGDPIMKGQRRQLHQEWAQQNKLAAVRKASAVVVNPTHIAVAILYDEHETELPIVCAKGEGHEAQLIREAAEEAGVPVMRNVELARNLFEEIPIDDYITADYFEAVAELLRWAESMRNARDGRS